MRRPTFAVLSLLLFSPSLTAAAPQCGPFETACHNPSPRPWRVLSDAIIRRIWGLPDKQKSWSEPNGETLPGRSPGRKLLARYGEDMVMRFNISTAHEASTLADAADVLFLDVWEFNENWVDIRIAKSVVPSLLGLLPPSLQTAHVALMQDLDLAQAIFDSYPSASSSGTQPHDSDRAFSPSLLKTSSQSQNIFFRDYQPLSVITPWMNLMASMFTTHVRRINVGISYEGRDIPGLRVGVHPTNDDQPVTVRKTILVTGGSHAREWISTSTVNYLAWSLITSYGKDQWVTRLLEAYDFVFVPTLNPDGYVYSWEIDRLWRKNRQPTSLRFCQGIDLDRSYPFHWDDEPSKANPCSESFPGDSPFDGVEAQRFAEWAKNETESNNVEFVAYLDLHSYSQQILYPYSFSCNEEPPTLEDLEELAMGLAKAIRVSRKGHPYQVTSACEGNVAASKDGKDRRNRIVFPRIEPSGGSALDWFYHELRIKYAFQVKLRDTGSYGFLLPKEHIVPTGKEMLDATYYLGRFLLGEVGMEIEATHEEVGGVPLHRPEDVDGNDNDEVNSSLLEAPELRRRRRR